MDFKIQLTGLNELLSIIYGDKMQLTSLLHELGFEASQVEVLQGQHLESIVAEFLEGIQKRLTSYTGKDTYYQILIRRYGLVGESPCQLFVIDARNINIPEYFRDLFDEVI